jgi:IQ domain-containing protein G
LEKLSFLDMLKSNMGDEMAEMMSQEITRVMEQQRKLEKDYASLVTLRSELKGLSNKNRLQEIRHDILVSIRNLRWIYVVPNFTRHCMSPPFLLQPLEIYLSLRE